MIKKNKYFYLIFFLIVIFFFQPLKSDEMSDFGKDVFLNKGNCVACHTLADAKSAGKIGPNLDQIKPEMMRVLNAVTMGIGIMPAYEDILTTKEIESVAYYVSESTK